MTLGRPKPAVVLAEEERCQLNAIASSRLFPQGLVRRARLVLMAADGLSNAVIAEKLQLSPQSVCKWRPWYAGPCSPGPRTVLTGLSAPSPGRAACTLRPSIASGGRSACIPTGNGTSDFARIPTSSRRCATSWTTPTTRAVRSTLAGYLPATCSVRSFSSGRGPCSGSTSSRSIRVRMSTRHPCI